MFAVSVAPFVNTYTFEAGPGSGLPLLFIVINNIRGFMFIKLFYIDVLIWLVVSMALL